MNIVPSSLPFLVVAALVIIWITLFKPLEVKEKLLFSVAYLLQVIQKVFQRNLFLLLAFPMFFWLLLVGTAVLNPLRLAERAIFRLNIINQRTDVLFTSCSVCINSYLVIQTCCSKEGV